MKIKDVLLEAIDIKAMFDKKFTDIRSALGMDGINLLLNYAGKKSNKKGHNVKGSPELLELFKHFKLIHEGGKVNYHTVYRFLAWLIKEDVPEVALNRGIKKTKAGEVDLGTALQHVNFGPELNFLTVRADANKALSQGHIKRDNDWMPPAIKQGRKIVKGLSEDEKVIFGKLFNRYLNKRTRHLSLTWKDMPENELDAMVKKGIISDNMDVSGKPQLTDKGELAIQYYIALRDDPNGLDRVSSSERVTNYGEAEERFVNRVKKVMVRVKRKMDAENEANINK